MKVSPVLEELDFGDWSGRTFTQLERQSGWRQWSHDRDYARFPADPASITHFLSDASGLHIEALNEVVSP